MNAVVCVWLMYSCGEKSQVTHIKGVDGYSTYTARVEGETLLGVQDAIGKSIRDPQYKSVEYQNGYFIAMYPSYEECDMFDANGKEFMLDVQKRFCMYKENRLAILCPTSA